MTPTKLRKQIPIRMEKLKDKELLAWERNFYNSFNHSTTLTQRQLSTLTKIEVRLSKKNKEREDWLREWDYQKESNFQLACNYYYTDGKKGSKQMFKKHYKIIKSAKRNPNDVVPTRKQYKILVENKYVKRAIDSYFDDPKFNVGDLVYVTGEYAYRLLKENRWVGLVIKPATREFIKKEKKYIVKPMSKVTFSMYTQFEDAIIPEKYLFLYRGTTS
jgi:hypothetical protein